MECQRVFFFRGSTDFWLVGFKSPPATGQDVLAKRFVSDATGSCPCKIRFSFVRFFREDFPLWSAIVTGYFLSWVDLLITLDLPEESSHWHRVDSSDSSDGRLHWMDPDASWPLNFLGAWMCYQQQNLRGGTIHRYVYCTYHILYYT